MAAPDRSKWLLNHTMLRVKDPARSVKFYELLGMNQIRKLEFAEAKFDLYFLAFDGPSSVSGGKHWTDRQGLIELTHNYGTEKDGNYKIHNGNSEPLGFGHVSITVDNLDAACARIEQAGYRFHTKPGEGRIPSLALALDPDDYWVEILSQKSGIEEEKTKAITTTDTGTYRFNNTQLRIKNPEASLGFYRDILGMTLLQTSEHKDAGFTLYSVGYKGDLDTPKQSTNDINPLRRREGILELAHYHGTERKEGQVYHNGNDQPQGFGHICVSVDDLDATCQYLEDSKVNWKKRLTDGRMKNVAFVLDPDNYWVEVIQNEKLKKSSKW